MKTAGWFAFCFLASSSWAAFAPRDVLVDDASGRFINPSTGAPEVLRGANVVVKGPPFLPSTNGTEPCNSSAVCRTFNAGDVAYFKSRGYNMIRLGVIWAGGQPTEALELDSDFVARLHAILDLCHENGIRVLLDLHQDAMGTAVCGEGVPMWYSKKHLPHLIGAPVVGAKSKLAGKCSVTDFASWRAAAGDPNYNVLNECCTRINVPGPWGMALDPSVGVQLTFAHLVTTAEGRSSYAAYVKLLAEAVASHPAAIGIELMNEPPFWQDMPFEASSLFDLFRECYDAVRAVSAELAVGVADSGQVPRYSNDDHLNAATRAWLRSNATTHLLYTFHHYNSGFPPFNESIANANALSKLWKAAPVMTEFGFDAADAAFATQAGVAWTYYEYNSYCNVPVRSFASSLSSSSSFSDSQANSGNCTGGEPCAFGACIT